MTKTKKIINNLSFLQIENFGKFLLRSFVWIVIIKTDSKRFFWYRTYSYFTVKTNSFDSSAWSHQNLQTSIHMFLFVWMPSHWFLYKQSVDIFESPCYQDFMRAGRNLASLGTGASSKAHFHIYDNFWQLKSLWKWWKMLFISSKNLFPLWKYLNICFDVFSDTGK